MSRQIYFIQSAADADAFIAEVYRRKGQLVDARTILTQSESLATFRRNVQTNFCRFQIIPEVNRIDLLLGAKQRNIEFLASVRGSSQSHTYHTGRLYLSELLGAVTPELVHFSNGLRYYIRKSYVYCKRQQIYFGPAFLEKYPTEHWSAAEFPNGRLLEIPQEPR